MELTFGEQIKILLNRESKTIKEFAELIEASTGLPCSRQNLTQKLKRDNFQEQDMRVLAAVLGYKVCISLEPASQEELADELDSLTPFDAGIIPEEPIPEEPELHTEEVPAKTVSEAAQQQEPLAEAVPAASMGSMEAMLETARSFTAAFRKKTAAPAAPAAVTAADRPDLPPDCINPYNGKEYLTNTVRKHPQLEHYIQVYDQLEHGWVDVAEDFFLRFQEQKRQMMGKDYSQPIYI